jgi:capsular polysaccharide biosynthesis protein
MTTPPTTVQERIALPPSGSGGSAGGSSAMTAGDILGILRRRIVLIVLLSILFGSMAIGGFYLWWQYFPSYRAEALILCVTDQPETELQVAPERLRQDEYERFVQTQAMLVKNPEVLRGALQRTALRETEWFKKIPEGEHQLALENQLRSFAIRNTNFFTVVMQTRNQEDPRVIVQSVVDEWAYYTGEEAARPFRAQQQEANESLNTHRGMIATKREQLRQIASTLPPGATVENVANITAQNVLQYGEQVTTLQLELALIEQFRQIYNDPQGPAVTAEDREAVEADPQVALLSQQVFGLTQQRIASLETFGEEHAEIRAIDAQLKAAQDELFRLRSRKLEERRIDNQEAVNTAYQSTQYALFLAQENLEKAEAELLDQDQALFEYRNLQEEIDRDVEFGVRLKEYADNLKRIVDQKTALRVSVAQAPIEPMERSAPSLLLLPFGVLLAVSAAIGLAVGLELLDTSVRTTQDIVRHLEIPVLGAVPDIDDEEVAIDSAETALRDAPRSLIAEAFRRVRTNLQFSAPASQQRTVLVTSPRPEDGKTTVAVNLAMAVAQGGSRVLLIDGNLRRPASTWSSHRWRVMAFPTS